MSIEFYDQNADDFFSRTVSLDLGEIWSRFEALLPENARILDAGCGSGRDAAHFRAKGHRIKAIDASPEMCAKASEHLGEPVECVRLEELAFSGEFEGVWCCAAALHVAEEDILDVVARLHEALVVGGVCYLSFKLGAGVRQKGLRRFLDMDEMRLRALLESLEGVELKDLWITEDTRAGFEGARWVNSLSYRL